MLISVQTLRHSKFFRSSRVKSTSIHQAIFSAFKSEIHLKLNFTVIIAFSIVKLTTAVLTSASLKREKKCTLKKKKENPC